MAMCERLAKEIAYRESIGCERLSVAEFGRRFAALGYRIDRTMDCRSSARYVTGPRAGESYPACDTGINEADTGLRAWNYAARRDAAFEAMQALRQQVFAVTRDGFILEV